MSVTSEPILNHTIFSLNPSFPQSFNPGVPSTFLSTPHSLDPSIPQNSAIPRRISVILSILHSLYLWHSSEFPHSLTHYISLQRQASAVHFVIIPIGESTKLKFHLCIWKSVSSQIHFPSMFPPAEIGPVDIDGDRQSSLQIWRRMIVRHVWI